MGVRNGVPDEKGTSSVPVTSVIPQTGKTRDPETGSRNQPCFSDGNNDGLMEVDK